MVNKIFLNDLHDLGTETTSEMEAGTQSLEQLYILGYYVLSQKTVVGNNNASKKVMPHLEFLPSLAIFVSIPKN